MTREDREALWMIRERNSTTAIRRELEKMLEVLERSDEGDFPFEDCFDHYMEEAP